MICGAGASPRRALTMPTRWSNRCCLYSASRAVVSMFEVESMYSCEDFVKLRKFIKNYYSISLSKKSSLKLYNLRCMDNASFIET